MGLYDYEIKIIADLAKRRREVVDRRLQVLSLGHPDILATPQELAFLGDLPIDNKEVREARKGLPLKNVIGNARPVFRAMGAKLTTVDIRKDLYNIDYEVDLNYQISIDKATILQAPFDIVIDGGAT